MNYNIDPILLINNISCTSVNWVQFAALSSFSSYSIPIYFIFYFTLHKFIFVLHLIIFVYCYYPLYIFTKYNPGLSFYFTLFMLYINLETFFIFIFISSNFYFYSSFWLIILSAFKFINFIIFVYSFKVIVYSFKVLDYFFIFDNYFSFYSDI